MPKLAEVTHDVESIPDAVTAQYLHDLANPVPERPRIEAVIEREATYVFRTRAGTTENARITIPGPSAKELLGDDKLAKRVERVYARKYGQEKLDYYEDLRDRVGSHRIAFRRVGVGKGCVYQTNDPVVAEFIRGFIRTGEINGLYEDYATSSMLRSRYTEQLFPNTEIGRQQLAQYDMAIEASVKQRAAEEAALDEATRPDTEPETED